MLPSILFTNDPRPAPTAKSPLAAPAPGASTPQLPMMASDVAPARVNGVLLLAIQSHLRVFAYCDVPPSFLEQARLRAHHQVLALRLVFSEALGDFVEVPLPIGEHGLFVDVPKSGASCHAELGLRRSAAPDSWELLLKSAPAEIPPAPDAKGASPIQTPNEIVSLVRDALQKQVPLSDLLDHLHSSGQLSEAELSQLAESPWPGREATLLQELVRNLSQPPFPTSWGAATALESAAKGIGTEWASPLSLDSSSAIPSSPKAAVSGVGVPKDFWFNINVEVIVYGATEPDAQVTLAGQKVTLRKDGSFSQRYILPNGAFQLEASAEPQDGRERREVLLQLSRATALMGEVGAHPQDPGLNAPGKA